MRELFFHEMGVSIPSKLWLTWRETFKKKKTEGEFFWKILTRISLIFQKAMGTFFLQVIMRKKIHINQFIDIGCTLHISYFNIVILTCLCHVGIFIYLYKKNPNKRNYKRFEYILKFCCYFLKK